MLAMSTDAQHEKLSLSNASIVQWLQHRTPGYCIQIPTQVVQKLAFCDHHCECHCVIVWDWLWMLSCMHWSPNWVTEGKYQEFLLVNVLPQNDYTPLSATITPKILLNPFETPRKAIPVIRTLYQYGSLSSNFTQPMKRKQLMPLVLIDVTQHSVIIRTHAAVKRFMYYNDYSRTRVLHVNAQVTAQFISYTGKHIHSVASHIVIRPQELS